MGEILKVIVELVRAVDFAAHRHSAQRRKGIKAEPYIIHLTEVARLLAEATDGKDPGLVIAGLLHDAIEDTATTQEDLRAAFGDDVASLVLEVTDDKRLPREERKRLQIELAPSKSLRARMIKIADKTSNLHSLADSPPVGWSAHRRAEYVDWARRVVAACGPTNARLEALFAQAAAAASHR
jgi:guanosine-3',5'-bis(diphosphate) 3'-pyrophosphohydrolase